MVLDILNPVRDDTASNVAIKGLDAWTRTSSLERPNAVVSQGLVIIPGEWALDVLVEFV